MDELTHRNDREALRESQKETLRELGVFYTQAPDGCIVNDQYADTVVHAVGDLELTVPRLRLAHSERDLVEDPDGRRYAYPDFQSPVLDEYGMDIGYHWVGPRGGIKEYLVYREHGRPPMYVFDNHNHALFAWQEAREAGILRDNAVLLHIDDHDDLSPFNQRNQQPAHLSRQFIREHFGEAHDEISIQKFIEPAIAEGLITEMYFFHGVIDHAEQFDERTTSAYMRTLLHRDFLHVFSLEGEVYASQLTAMLAACKASGRDIILDIDFDVFRQDLDEERRKKLQQVMRIARGYATLITCATSPGYGSHTNNVAHAQAFVREYFADVSR